MPICWIRPPINLLPSEGRNLGAHFSRSDILVFLDDDALMASGYLVSVQNREQSNEFLALRGRILPKSTTATPPPKQYDLGETVLPSEFNLEGNMVIRRSLFYKLGSFDPLMFGHEGKALTQQWRTHFPSQIIKYCPELIIRHDWDVRDNLEKKRERQALGKEYLNYLKEHKLNEGISIIVRAGDKFADVQSFLDGLVKHNNYKPIEVLIWAKDSNIAVSIVRPYMAKFFTLVLPAKTKSFGRVAQTCRYTNCLIVDMPTQILGDVFQDSLLRKQIDLKNSLLCTKTDLEKLGDTQIIVALNQISKKLGKNLSDVENSTTPQHVNGPLGKILKSQTNSLRNKTLTYKNFKDEKFLRFLMLEKEKIVLRDRDRFIYF